MKNTYFYALLALVCLFTSCSKSDDTPDDTTPGDGGYVSGTYWPYAVDNAWYMVNEEDPTDKSDLFIHKTVTHEGKTYFQFRPLGIEVDPGLTGGFREDKGVFIELHGATSMQGVNTSAGTITSINTNLKVGEVWKDEMTLTISGIASGTIKHVNEGKILDKVASVTINGKTYKDVLKTELKKTTSVSTAGTNVITLERWLAKGIGIIYDKTTYDGAFSDSYSLVSHTVK